MLTYNELYYKSFQTKDSMKKMSKILNAVVKMVKNDPMFSDISKEVIRREFSTGLKDCEVKIIAAVIDNVEFSSGNRELTEKEQELKGLAEAVIDIIFDMDFMDEIAINNKGEELEEDGFLEDAVYESLITLSMIDG